MEGWCGVRSSLIEGRVEWKLSFKSPNIFVPGTGGPTACDCIQLVGAMPKRIIGISDRRYMRRKAPMWASYEYG